MTSTISILATAIAFAGLAGSSGAQEADGTYRAELSPLNVATTGTGAQGTAVLTISGDELTIRIDVTGTAPDIMHLQHFHGFADGSDKSRCATDQSDSNGDGIIDLIETEADAGITMVPFHGDPVSMAIVADTYPTADAQGAYRYEQTVSLPDLAKAFADAFPGQPLDLERQVIFLHGVPETTALPKSVQSLGDVPAQVTLPIACGEISRTES